MARVVAGLLGGPPSGPLLHAHSGAPKPDVCCCRESLPRVPGDVLTGVPSSNSQRQRAATPSPGNRGVEGSCSGRRKRYRYARHRSENGLSGTVTHSALTFWSQNVRNRGVAIPSLVKLPTLPTRRANTVAHTATKKVRAHAQWWRHHPSCSRSWLVAQMRSFARRAVPLLMALPAVHRPSAPLVPKEEEVAVDGQLDVSVAIAAHEGVADGAEVGVAGTLGESSGGESTGVGEWVP